MKIALGDGSYLEPDEPPRDTPFHMRILSVRTIPNTRSGHIATLECGHLVRTFGRLALAEGRVLCTQCRDAAEA